MKFHPIFQHYLNCGNESEVFQHFQDTLTDSITLWNYFVNWQKVLKNEELILNHKYSAIAIVSRSPTSKIDLSFPNTIIC